MSNIILNLISRDARNKNDDDNETPFYSIGGRREVTFAAKFDVDTDFKESLKKYIQYIKKAYEEAKFNNNNTNSSDEIINVFDIINNFIENYKNNNNFYSNIVLNNNNIPLKFNYYQYQNKLILWYLSNRNRDDEYSDNRGMIYVDIRINNEIEMNMMMFDITFFGDNNYNENGANKTDFKIADNDIFSFLHDNSIVDIKN